MADELKMTLVFSTSSSWISKAIRWFTRSKSSHCMIGLEVHGTPMLLHCTAGGVQFDPRDKWFKGNVLVSEWQFKDDVGAGEEGLRHAMSHLGENYDYLTLFGWGLVILLWRYLKVRAKNPLSSPTAMVCSEFALHVGMKEEGKQTIPEWEGLDPEHTHCQDLLDRMPGSSFIEVK